MVGHQDVAVDSDAVNLHRSRKKLHESTSIRVIPEYIFALIATAGDVVNSARILNSERAGHEKD